MSIAEDDTAVDRYAPTLRARLGEFAPGARLQSAMLVGVVRPRSRVWRCVLDRAPGSVIVKTMRGFDAADSKTYGGIRARLAREYAGAMLLAGAPGDHPLGPSVYAIDRDHDYLVLEDLGTGASLAQALFSELSEPVATRGQRDEATFAAESLCEYARALARLHAATLGQHRVFEALAARVLDDPAPDIASPSHHTPAQWLGDDVPALLAVCERLGLETGPAFPGECVAIAAKFSDAGQWLAFSSGDACPDNHIRTAHGLRFLDFELGSFRHLFLDHAYLHMRFPTCWGVAQLPDEALHAAEIAYRNELAPALPAIADDVIYQPLLAQACAFWAIRSLNLRPDKGWHLDAVLTQDAIWSRGRATLRPRHVLRLEAAAAQCARAGVLPACQRLFERLSVALRARWGAEAEMALYHAWRAT